MYRKRGSVRQAPKLVAATALLARAKWKSSVGHGAVRYRPSTGPQYSARRNAYLPDHCGTTVRQKLAQLILTGDWVLIFCPVRCNHKREPNKRSSTEYSGELRGIIQDERDAQDAFSRRSRPKGMTLARQPQCKANCLKSGKVIVRPQDVIPVQNLEWFHDGLPSKAVSQRLLWPQTPTTASLYEIPSSSRMP